MKRKVFLLAGFQNWGKTRLIRELFSPRKNFLKNYVYPLHGYDFCVMSISNDDLGKEGYEAEYQERMDELNKRQITPKYILSAFCPTKEHGNESADIIRNIYSKDDIILIPIEYKWCNHAKLQIDELIEYYSVFKNIKLISLSQKDPTKKLKSLNQIIGNNLT